VETVWAVQRWILLGCGLFGLIGFIGLALGDLWNSWRGKGKHKR
jgi:hypothetical protein